MLTINNKPTNILPLVSFGDKDDQDVDKRSNRDTPGESEGARPPKKEEYKERQRKNDKEKDDGLGEDQKVDNEEKDKNKR
ncbi:hypothetical protein ACFOUP_16615 [Belliella kenyensis]|uniref:Uncharacterized protein n=1 Tax=Belliella kenyensis TaxID=1472724 RepID=A0ABV8EPN5_9BACT|nr:hypothetical protein [Belliella kenyensis]MCH7402928.1 hypothetical protein [Belliella kenyensis]MDN3602634.1 hypothetical protein [Belliella kenyensis]